jgi:hypothetical protein
MKFIFLRKHKFIFLFFTILFGFCNLSKINVQISKKAKDFIRPIISENLSQSSK